jgi:thiol-disulfide isomerase/thioredoxin
MILLKPFCRFYFITIVFLSFAFTQNVSLKGQEAPGFYLSDLENNDFFLTESLDKPLFINFFATWCGPCITEIEDLKNLYIKNKESINMIIIDETNLNQLREGYDTRLDIKNALKEYNIPFQVLYDKYAVVAEEFKVISKKIEIDKRVDGIDMPVSTTNITMPSSFIINTKGIIVWEKRKKITKSEFRQLSVAIKRGMFE